MKVHQVLSNGKDQIIFEITHGDPKNITYIPYRSIDPCEIPDRNEYHIIRDKAVIDSLVSSHDDIIKEIMSSEIFSDLTDDTKDRVLSAYLPLSDLSRY